MESLVEVQDIEDITVLKQSSLLPTSHPVSLLPLPPLVLPVVVLPKDVPEPWLDQVEHHVCEVPEEWEGGWVSEYTKDRSRVGRHYMRYGSVVKFPLQTVRTCLKIHYSSLI